MDSSGRGFELSLGGVEIPALDGLLGMSQDEAKNVIFLVASIPLGYMWSKLPNGSGMF